MNMSYLNIFLVVLAEIFVFLIGVASGFYFATNNFESITKNILNKTVGDLQNTGPDTENIDNMMKDMINKLFIDKRIKEKTKVSDNKKNGEEEKGELA